MPAAKDGGTISPALNLTERKQMAVRISRTAKLGVKSWSLQSLETCPGSLNEEGNLVDACSGCYATDGYYVMGHVKEPRAENKEDWEREEDQKKDTECH